MPRASSLAIVAIVAAAATANAALVEGELLQKLQAFETQKKQIEAQELALVKEAMKSENLRSVDLTNKDKLAVEARTIASHASSGSSGGSEFDIATPKPTDNINSASFSSGETGSATDSAASNATATTTAPPATKKSAASVQLVAPAALSAAVIAWTLL